MPSGLLDNPLAVSYNTLTMKREIICEVCSKKKSVSRSDAKYCSARCKNIGWALKKASKLTNKKK